MSKVNIVMATYNRLAMTKQTIPNIIETTNSDKTPFMITVVDNGSTDGTVEYLTSLFDAKVIDTLILLDNNIGVAKAQNIGWKLFEEVPYYAKIDNDVIFTKNGWLDDLIYVFDNAPEIGVLGYNCEPTMPPHTLIDNGRVQFNHKAGNVGGACHFVSKKINKIVGFWCEDYDLYGEEDADYGVRVSVSGFKNCYMLDNTTLKHLPEERDTYREFKDEQRNDNLKTGLFASITGDYYNGTRPLMVETNVLNEVDYKLLTNG